MVGCVMLSLFSSLGACSNSSKTAQEPRTGSMQSRRNVGADLRDHCRPSVETLCRRTTRDIAGVFPHRESRLTVLSRLNGGNGSVRSQMFVAKQISIQFPPSERRGMQALYRTVVDLTHSAPLGRRVFRQGSCSILIGLL